MLSEVRARIAQFTPEGTMKQPNKTMLLTAALLLAAASANAEKPKKAVRLRPIAVAIQTELRPLSPA